MPNPRGFSLLELLVVLAVIALLATLLLPAANQIIDGHTLRTTTNQLVALIERGRVDASIKQHAVAVRFFQGDDADVFTAVQLFTMRTNDETPAAGPVTTPLTPPMHFDNRVALSEPLSGAMTNSMSRSGQSDLHGITTDYWEFLIFPSGSLSLEESYPSPFLTLTTRSDLRNPGVSPKNPVVVSLDPFTGKASTFQR